MRFIVLPYDFAFNWVCYLLAFKQIHTYIHTSQIEHLFIMATPDSKPMKL